MSTSTRRSGSKRNSTAKAAAKGAPTPTAKPVVARANVPAKVSPPQRPKGSPRPPTPSAVAPLPRRVPAKSVARAKAAFANFSLSKFAAGTTPPNYVAPTQATAAVQRQVISKQLVTLPSNNALTFALPAATLTKLLPSYNAKAGTVTLSEVMNALEQNIRGNEFYANGDPTLSRLAIRAQVQDIIAGVIQGAK